MCTACGPPSAIGDAGEAPVVIGRRLKVAGIGKKDYLAPDRANTSRSACCSLLVYVLYLS